jgi:hypothetical protein
MHRDYVYMEDATERNDIMHDIWKKLIDQITSGRWILTVICGIVFAFAVWKRILPDAATASILTSVFTAYFGRQDRTPTNGGTK